MPDTKKGKVMTEVQEKLVSENHNLIYSFLKERGLEVEEFYDVAAIGLCSAAIDFDNSVAAFSTFAYSRMWREVAKVVRHENTIKCRPEGGLVYYQQEIVDDRGHTVSWIDLMPSNDNVEKEVLNKVILEGLRDELSERDRSIIYLVSQGFTQSQVARAVCIAQPHVSRVIRRVRDRIIL